MAPMARRMRHARQHAPAHLLEPGLVDSLQHPTVTTTNFSHPLATSITAGPWVLTYNNASNACLILETTHSMYAVEKTTEYVTPMNE